MNHQGHDASPDGPAKKGHSRWMMVACCVPMLVIAVVIALSGAGLGFLIGAVVCTAAMVAMMGGMASGRAGK